MTDDTLYEQVMNGAEAINALSKNAPTQELMDAAQVLSERLSAGQRAPTAIFIVLEGESILTEYDTKAMDTFVNAAKHLPPEYSQPAFQCLEDFEKCKKVRKTAFLCGLVLAVCLVERLIPKQEIRSKSDNKADVHRTSILFLAADPTDTSRLRLGEEFREINEKLRSSQMRDQINLVLPQLSVRTQDIVQALLDFQPQIVHFSGHGTAMGELCFEDQAGGTHLVQPDALEALFKQFADQVDCVVLNACFSDVQAKAISQHINYVIGMNQEISDKAAIAFSTGFYQALGAGRTIDDAYQLGCVQIQLQGLSVRSMPILVKYGS